MIIATGDTVSLTLAFWLTGIVVPMIVAALTGGLLVYLLQRSDAKRARRREGYAEAMAALAAWAEYPYRIRRRTSDQPDELARLVGIGHDLQERLARAQAWIAADDTTLLTVYQASLTAIRTEAAPYLNEAWAAPPITTPAEMALGDWGPLGASALIAALANQLSDHVK